MVVNEERIENKLTEAKIPLVRILIIAVVLGIILNWLAMYLNITLGFLGLGISPFFALLIARSLLRKKDVNKSNLTIIAISYGATRAAESAVGLLFLIWLYFNALPFFGVEFNPPSWLLPSQEVLSNNTILSSEWIIPLLVHWFVMLVPGITGIIFGYFLAPKFIHNNKEYPFPGIIQTTHQLDVLVTNDKSRTRDFTRFLVLGFLLATITLVYPFLDLSSPTNGWILGLAFGTVGIALFSIGFIIRDPKITIVSGVSSVLVYTFLSPFIVKSDFLDALALGSVTNHFYDFFTFALQHAFLSFLIGFMLAGMLLGPMIGKQIKIRLKPKKNNDKIENKIQPETAKVDETEETEINPNIENQTLSLGFFSIRRISISLVFTIVLISGFIFVTSLDIFPNVHPIIILGILFWIMVLGTVIQGFIAVKSIGKTSTVALPPFIFDLVPIFLTGARGWTPYIATPKGEIDGTMGMVRSMKLASINNVQQKHTILGYMAGYIAATITTPFFALLLWQTLGIGTAQLPAPAFPIQGAFIAPFALGTFEGFIVLSETLLGALGGLIVGAFSSTAALAVAIGILFPPHMGLMITLGGLLRLILEKKYGKEKIQAKGNFRATAFSVGATLSVPILIILTILG